MLAGLSLSFGVVQAKRSDHVGIYGVKPQKQYSCTYCNTNDHYVSPKIRRNGQFVQGHMKTDSNGSTTDNFSHKQNVNPYTGKKGYRP